MSLDRFRSTVAEAVAGVCGMDAARIQSFLEAPRNAAHGDIAFPCFRVAKELGRKPPELAAEIVTKTGAVFAEADAGDGRLIEEVSAAGPFVNFRIDGAALAREVLRGIVGGGAGYGGGDDGVGKCVVVDYSSPNIAKPFGVGHLRSTVIGGALVRLYRHLGFSVVGVNHLGDWGTQFGKLAMALDRCPEEMRPDLAGADVVRRLYDLYVWIHQQDEGDGAIDSGAREWFRRLEEGDEASRDQWQELRQVSLREFDRIYERLGVSFESIHGESEYNGEPLLEALRLAQEGGGELVRESDGALIADLEAEGLGVAVLRKADGASLYLTRDIAGVLHRVRAWKPAKLLYVVGAPQTLHFKQLGRLCAAMDQSLTLLDEDGREVPRGWAEGVSHVPFGHYLGMSTRKGTLVFLEELLDEAHKRAREVTREANPDLSDHELDLAAEAVGTGAVIFNDLKQSRSKDISFNWERMLSLGGDSGPYLQFGYARLSGIMRRWEAAEPQVDDVDVSLLAEPRTRTLLLALARFPDAVREAVRVNEPCAVSQYLLELAAAVHAFLHEHRVLQADSPEQGQARYLLVQATRSVLGTGLELLGIRALERM